MPGGLGANFQCHPDPVPGIEPRSANLDEIPVGPKVAGSHLGICLEPAAREDNGAGRNRLEPTRAPRSHAAHAAIAAHDQPGGLILVPHFDPCASRGVEQLLRQPPAPTAGPEDHPAREPAPPFIQGRPVHGLEAHPLGAQPSHRRVGTVH